MARSDLLTSREEWYASLRRAILAAHPATTVILPALRQASLTEGEEYSLHALSRTRGVTIDWQ